MGSVTVSAPDSEDRTQCGSRQRRLDQIRPDVTYFALTLRDSHGKLERSIQTRFAGFPEGVEPTAGFELREAAPVDPFKMMELWDHAGHPWVVVNTFQQLREYVRRGGEALITEELAREYFADVVEPRLCFSKGAAGFMRYTSDAPDLTVRSRKKQKRRIRKRDGHRCQRCGAQVGDDSSTRLEVHHVRAFSKGGPTADPNLTTLCHECNEETGDDFEPGLYWVKGGPIASAIDSESAEGHREAVDEYRRRVQRMLQNRGWH